ncbi:fimbrial protein [Salmonella enterica]|nr:hypothetical protein [Salmonella enterica subsp. enterica serovar Sandiego]EEK2576827.1 fimbrial protein [Salmonella enterica subsp. enterica serovar Montevideo]
MRKFVFSISHAGYIFQNNSIKHFIVRNYWFLFLPFFFLYHPGKALAGYCDVDKTFYNESVSFGAINVSGSLPIGSVIKEVQTQAPGVLMGTCYGNYYYGNDLNYSSTSTAINNVYETNLKGVGIKVWGLYSDYSPDKLKSYTSATFGYYLPIVAQLIKTGPITPGNLKTGKLITFKWQGGNGYVYTPVIAYVTGINSIHVNACTVNNNGVVNVTMKPVKKSAFSGVGSTAGKTHFNIGLSCEKNALIQVSFSPPAEGSPDKNKGVINISRQTNGAEGVGIQLLYDLPDNKSPVIFNQKKTIVQYSSAGYINIPLASQYYKLKPSVTAGKVAGYITFTVTHQ